MSDEKPENAAGAEGSEAMSDELRGALATPCVVRLRQSGSRFTACIPELGILADGASADAAYAEAMRLRERRIREFAAEGLLAELPRPGTSEEAANKKRLLPQLKVFLIKAAVVAALFLMAVNVIGGGLRDTGYVLEKKLDSVTRWSPEEVEKNRAKAARIVEKLGPLLRELAGAFARPGPASQMDNATANGTEAR